MKASLKELLFSFSVLFVVIISCKAEARVDCDIYPYQSNWDHAVLDKNERSLFFSLSPGMAASVCNRILWWQNKNSYRTYYTLSTIKKQKDVCIYNSKQVFPGDAKGGYLWKESQTPTVYMQISAGDCPSHDDKNYLPMSGVSVEVFQSIMDGWSRLLASPSEFRKLFLGQVFNPEYHSLQKAMYAKNYQRPKIVQIEWRQGKRRAEFDLVLRNDKSIWGLTVHVHKKRVTFKNISVVVID